MNDIARIETEEPVDIAEEIRNRILHVLKIYPKLSPSMLQIGVGSSLPPSMWKPILKEMIEKGTVKEDFEMHPTPTGRHNTYTLLSLTQQVK